MYLLRCSHLFSNRRLDTMRERTAKQLLPFSLPIVMRGVCWWNGPRKHTENVERKKKTHFAFLKRIAPTKLHQIEILDSFEHCSNEFPNQSIYGLFHKHGANIFVSFCRAHTTFMHCLLHCMYFGCKNGEKHFAYANLLPLCRFPLVPSRALFGRVDVEFFDSLLFCFISTSTNRYDVTIGLHAAISGIRRLIRAD